MPAERVYEVVSRIEAPSVTIVGMKAESKTSEEYDRFTGPGGNRYMPHSDIQKREEEYQRRV